MKSKLLDWLNKGGFLDLRALQWTVPLFLSVTAIIFEFVEHGLEDELRFDLSFVSEVIIFGFMGPVIVGFIIAWMRELVNAEKQAIAEVHTLNRELEHKVAERTSALEERNLELAHANAELQKLDQMKSEFVSLVSHELRAPLTALNGGLELALQTADTLPSASRGILETMMYESARLTEFVQTILDVSRLESGQFNFNFGPVAVTPILRRAAEIVLGARRPIEWSLPAEIPPIWADEIYYEQIIRNLLRNADKYSPPDAPILIKVKLEAVLVHVKIIDHGEGIPPEMQTSIFERFQRGHSGENALPGWGLGLYFAKKLSDAQSGSLTLISPYWDNAEHPGTAFCLTVPIAANEPEDEAHV